MEIIIATRRSKLAQIQTNRVSELLKIYGINSSNLLIETEGDRRLDISLDKIGGKGLFTKEVEFALFDKSADIAVHSLKDLPYQIPDEFEIIAIPEREDERDVFISREGVHFDELKSGARIGTSSVRRAGLLKMLRSDLIIEPIRGNVNTRLLKMEQMKLDGIILAAAGIKRLNLDNIITDYFDPEVFIPAIGQGALAVECLKSNPSKEIIKLIDNKDERIRAEAERSFMKMLNGDCHSLIGAYSKINGETLTIIGTSNVNGKVVKDRIEGNKNESILLGQNLGKMLLDKWS